MTLTRQRQRRQKSWLERNGLLLILGTVAAVYCFVSRKQFGWTSIGLGLGLVTIAITFLCSRIDALITLLAQLVDEQRNRPR